jgi:hypothetical protein
MKKKLAGILAVLMVLSMGMTVFAAPSSNKDSDMKKAAAGLVTTVQSGSDTVALTADSVNTDDLASVYDIVAGKIGSSTGFNVLAAVELSSVNALPDGGLQITFDVTGVTSGEANIRIYHKKGTDWEVKTPFVGNGYVTATFDSLSPFFVVRYDSTPSVSDGSVDSSTVVNNYYNTYTTNNTNSNNITSSTSTNSNNPTTTNNSNSNNPATTNYTNSNNTNSNNETTTNNAASSSSSTKKSTSSSKKSSTSTTDKVSAKSAGDGNSGTNNQTVTVNVNGNGSSSGKAGVSTSTTSPKTGSSMPALPMIAVFAVMGIAFCGKKARSL